MLSKLSRTYAGKSGSTETDSWMIGFTPQIVTGVWVGYDQPKSISNVAEQGYAKRIWTDTMEKGLDGQPKKSLNNQVTSLQSILTLKTENCYKNCPISVKMYFAKGTEPTEYCMDHVDDKEEFEKTTEEKKTSWWKNIFLGKK